MKVLLLAPGLSGIGGISRYMSALLSAMRKGGEDVVVVNREVLSKPAFVARAFMALFTQRPDVVLCGHVHFAPLCGIFRLFGFPFVVFGYGVEAWNVEQVLLRWGLGWASLVVPISRYTGEQLMLQFPTLAGRFFILPCTVDSTRFAPAPRPEALVARHQLSKAHVILTVARLSASERYKGYDEVIRALPAVKKAVPSAVYVIVGDGDDSARVRRLARDLGVDRDVIMVGSVSEHELPDYYNLADVFAMPSKGEGFGIVFIEALACGVPVVAADRGGVRDALLGGELGVFTDPDDASALAQAIVAVLKRKVPQKYLDGESLRKKTLRAFGPESFEKKVTELLGRFETL